MTASFRICIVSALTFAASCADTAPPAPELTGFKPREGVPGTRITVVGHFLAATFETALGESRTPEPSGVAGLALDDLALDDLRLEDANTISGLVPEASAPGGHTLRLIDALGRVATSTIPFSVQGGSIESRGVLALSLADGIDAGACARVEILAYDLAHRAWSSSVAVDVAIRTSPMTDAAFQLYRDEACRLRLDDGRVTLDSATAKNAFWLRSTRAGPITVEASARTFEPGDAGTIVRPGPGAALFFATPARTTARNDCSVPIALGLVDEFHNRTTSAEGVEIELGFDASTAPSLYSNALCSREIALRDRLELRRNSVLVVHLRGGSAVRGILRAEAAGGGVAGAEQAFVIVESVCGNGRVEAGEECDLGASPANTVGCVNCSTPSGFACLGEPSVCRQKNDTTFVGCAEHRDSNERGTRDDPYCEIADALRAPVSMTEGTAVVFVAAGDYEEPLRIDASGASATWRIVAERGAVLDTRERAGSAIELEGRRTLELDGLVIQSAASHGIEVRNAHARLRDLEVSNNHGVGIYVSGSSTLDLDRTIVRGNAEGGVRLEATHFAIANTVVAENGGTMAEEFGGIYVLGGADATSHIVNVAVVGNQSVSKESNASASLRCVDEGTRVFNAIVWQNLRDGVTSRASAACALFSSIVDPDVAMNASNVASSPRFVDTARSDYHIDVASPGIDRGRASLDTILAPSLDVDREPRPAGGAFDIGVDEVVGE